MKEILIAAAMLLPIRAVAQGNDMGEPEPSVNEYSQEDGSGVMIQDSDEDIRNLVEDYIKKDIALKGAFFIEDKSSGKVLSLKFVAITKTNLPEDGDKTVTAQFHSDGGKFYNLVFLLSGSNWGNMEIQKISIEPPSGPAKASEKDRPKENKQAQNKKEEKKEVKPYNQPKK